MNIVSRALEVLITSYSHAIKTGSYFKGTKAEKSPASSTQHIHSPKSAADDFACRGDLRGGALKIDSASEISNESHRRCSMLSDSDSEGNVGPSSAGSKGVMGTWVLKLLRPRFNHHLNCLIPPTSHWMPIKQKQRTLR